MSIMLEQAVAHIRAGEIEKARPLLIEVLKQNPGDENAWLLMSRCVTEIEQKRYCFEKVLRLNPQNQYAIRSLSYLNRPVSPPVQPKVSQQEPVQPVQKQGWGAALLNIVLFALALFLVLLCLYAWWLTR